MDGGGLVENLGGAAPDHGQAGGAGGFAEIADIVHQHFGVVHLGGLGLLVGAVDAAHEFVIEDGGHGLDGRERRAKFLEQRHFQHAGFLGGLVAVIGIDVPGSENQIVEAGEGDEILDARAAAFGALPEADGGHLGDRADGFGELAFDGLHAGDESGGDGAHAGDQYPELALRRRDRNVVHLGRIVDKCFAPLNLGSLPARVTRAPERV